MIYGDVDATETVSCQSHQLLGRANRSQVGPAKHGLPPAKLIQPTPIVSSIAEGHSGSEDAENEPRATK